MRWKEMTLTGWGGTTKALAEVARPERARDLQALVRTAHQNGIIAHGRAGVTAIRRSIRRARCC